LAVFEHAPFAQQVALTCSWRFFLISDHQRKSAADFVFPPRLRGESAFDIYSLMVQGKAGVPNTRAFRVVGWEADLRAEPEAIGLSQLGRREAA
jgi:hypothetical protein